MNKCNINLLTINKIRPNKMNKKCSTRRTKNVQCVHVQYIDYQKDNFASVHFCSSKNRPKTALQVPRRPFFAEKLNFTMHSK
jgi:hypothetical protein